MACTYKFITLQHTITASEGGVVDVRAMLAETAEDIEASMLGGVRCSANE